jgi:arylsulfatase A-like enzyme
MRSALRAAGLTGALLLALHLGTLGAATGLTAGMGAAVRDAVAAVSTEIIRFQVLLAAAVFAAGFLAGLAAWTLLRLARVGTGAAAPVGLLSVVAQLARTMARKPALFDALHLRPVQIFVAERVGSAALDRGLLICAAAAAACVLIRRPRARIAAVAIAGVALCVHFVPRRKATAPRAIVVLAADSLRPDRIQAATAPYLRDLLARSAVAEDVFVPIASTTASWVSMLTGVYPHTHGVRDLFPRDDVIRVPLPTLPRVLRQQGFRTVAVSDYAGESFSRVDLGFDAVDAPPATSVEVFAEREAMQRLPIALGLFTGALGQRLFPVTRYLLVNADPALLTDRAFARLDELERGSAPFLLLVFYSVTHAPFAAPMPDAAAFTSRAYRGASRYAYDLQQVSDIARAAERPPDAEIAQVRGLYDGALRSFDAEVGRFLARLDSDGLKDRLVVVTGDHGENLFEPGATTEHGKWFEGGEAANRTLLALQGPTIAPRRLAPLASGVDFFSTVLAATGVAAPPGLDGISLLGEVPADRTVFAESALWLGGRDDSPPGALWYPPILELLEVEPGTHALVLKRQYVDRTVTAKLRAARRGRWDLISMPVRVGRQLRLFDLEADPFGQRDVLAAHPDVAASLTSALDRWTEQDRLRWFDAEMKLVPRAEQ